MVPAQKIKTTTCFIAFIYFLMIWLDMTKSPYTSYIKWGAIWFCWHQSIMLCRISRQTNELLLMAGLGITFICDYFLLFTAHYTLGLFLFSMAHLLHCCRMDARQFFQRRKWIISAGMFLIACCFLFPLYAEILAGSAYAFCFGLHLFFAIKNRNKAPRFFALQIQWALGLFLLCDLCVLAFYLFHKRWIGVLIWVFYLPSQYLLSISPLSRQYHSNP